jgi:hypothetical protein
MKDSGALAIWRLRGAGTYTPEVPVALSRKSFPLAGISRFARDAGIALARHIDQPHRFQRLNCWIMWVHRRSIRNRDAE